MPEVERQADWDVMETQALRAELERVTRERDQAFDRLKCVADVAALAAQGHEPPQ